MAISDIPGYIMGHRFTDDSADYDSTNKVWYDKSAYAGRGTDVIVTAGDPASKFANVAAANTRRGVLMDNTWHAKVRCPIPWQGSMIVVVRPQNNSGTTTRARYPFLFGNAVTASSNGGLWCQYASAARNLTLITAASALTRTLARNDDNCRVVAFSTDQSTRKMHASSDGVTVTEATAGAATSGNAVALQAANEGIRIGNINSTAGDTTEVADFNLYLFEAHWFKGNVLVGAPLSQVATEIAALKSYYGAS